MASVEVGLVGLPNSGKSTVFNALTGARAAVAPHMFSTLESQSGLADVRDPRLAHGCLLQRIRAPREEPHIDGSVGRDVPTVRVPP